MVILVKLVAVGEVEETSKVKVVPLTITFTARLKIIAPEEEVVSIPVIEAKVETPLPAVLNLLMVTDCDMGLLVSTLKVPVNCKLLMTRLMLSAAYASVKTRYLSATVLICPETLDWMAMLKLVLVAEVIPASNCITPLELVISN